MFSMTEKNGLYAKTGHLEDKEHEDRGSYKDFCLVSCLSLLKNSVEVREVSRVFSGGIHLLFSRRLPLPFTTFSILSNSKANSSLPNLQVF